jgi:hypothetical protein
MAIDPNKALPYGLRDVKVTALTSDGTATVGSPVDLPVSQTFSFSETEDFQELRGDDRVAASRGGGPTVDWSLEAGGISLEAYAVMNGGLVTSSGVTPNVIKRYRKLATDARPYFKVEGQAINDNGGDFHCIVYRCKADGGIEGELADTAFWVTKASGSGYGSLQAATLDVVYDFIQNETATAIPPNNEIEALVLDATGGTFTATFTGQTTAAITASTLTPAILQTALEALSNIAPGDIIVTGPASPGVGIYYITFTGVYAGVNVAQITLNVASLTGGSAAVYTINQGG